MNKPYDVGLIVGRFQTFHKGHEKLVETGLLLCDRILILIGSAQESFTERNPYNITTREAMIREVYGNNPNIMIYGLSDMTNENDICAEWGRYLLDGLIFYLSGCRDKLANFMDFSKLRFGFLRASYLMFLYFFFLSEKYAYFICSLPLFKIIFIFAIIIKKNIPFLQCFLNYFAHLI